MPKAKIYNGSTFEELGVPTTRTVSAGNGLTGGGNLDSNITISLGTPSTITGATTNSVFLTTHTHAIRLDWDHVQNKPTEIRKIYVSTSEPTSSDGANGDIWLVYQA